MDINISADLHNPTDKIEKKIYKRDSSVLEYILNHRYDILDKIDKERSENRRYVMVDEN